MNQQIARKGARNKGQALVEYMLLVGLCVVIAGAINTTIKIGIKKMWVAMAKEIVPGCPGCELPPDVR